MELTISWSAIAKIMLIGFLTYAIYPALMVLRDWALWWLLEKFILDKELRTMIRIRADANWYLQNKYKLNRELKLGAEGAKYYLEGVEVSEEAYRENEDGISFYKNHLEIAAPKILWRSNLLIWILKHYKFDKDSNPIPKWCKNANEQAAKKNS
jgi:hypothetical protein